MKIITPVLLYTARQAGGPEAFEGILGGTSYYWGMEDRVASAKAFNDKFRKAYNGTVPSDYGALGYAGIMSVLQSVKNAKSTDTPKVIAAMEQLKYDWYKGPQFYRKCDHQSVQSVIVIESKSKNMKDKFLIPCIQNTECLACGKSNVRSILDLGHQPLANNYHKGEHQEKYPLNLTLCEDCFHLQLSHTVNPDLMFKNYLYVSGTAKTLRDYFDLKARTTEDLKEQLIKIGYDIKTIEKLTPENIRFNLEDEYKNIDSTQESNMFDNFGYVELKYKNSEYKIHIDRAIDSKKNYYYSKIMNCQSQANTDKLCEEYIRGFFWTYDYYFNIINPKSVLWNEVYSILTSGSANWTFSSFGFVDPNTYSVVIV